MTAPLLRPTEEQLALLSGFERTAFDICDFANRNVVAKHVGQAFLRTVGAGWVHYCTRNILRVMGLSHVTSLAPDRGVVIVANHRSFFDLYVVSCTLLRNASFVERMYFPVKQEFWYERPLGIAVNAAMSALAMYPPVMRKPEQRRFNEFGVDLLVEALAHRGAVVGFHPEGTRNKSDDPYTLLPAQPGVGQIVYRAKPIVVPAFVLGLGNHLGKQVAGNFDGTGEPITLFFGPPVDLSAELAEPPRLRTYKRIADKLREQIADLGVQDRAYRAEHGLPSKSKPA